MGFKFQKVSAKPKSGRGGADAEMVLATLLDSWDKWNEAVQEMDDAERTEFAEAFNDIIDESGDALTGGDKSALEDAMIMWDSSQKEPLVKFLCPEYFEVDVDE